MIRLFLVSLVASQVLGFDNPILVDLSNLSENIFDDGLDLLSQLYCSVIQEQKLIQKGDHLDNMARQLESIQNKRLSREQICNQIDIDILVLKNETEKNSNFVLYLNGRMDSNQKRISVLESAGCDSSVNFLEFMNSQQRALRLIDFLRVTLQKQGTTSLTQITEYVNLIQEDSDKKDMLNQLNDGESFIREQIDIVQNNQIKSYDSSQAFFYLLSRENQQLQYHLEQIISIIGLNPEKTISFKEKELKQCQEDIRTLTSQIRISELIIQSQNQSDEDDQDNCIIINSKYKERLINQAKLLKQIIKLYSKGIQQVDQEYKNSFQDITNMNSNNEDQSQGQLSSHYSHNEGNMDKLVEEIAGNIMLERQIKNNYISFIEVAVEQVFH